MYFHTDSARTKFWLASVLTQAYEQDRSIRFDVLPDGSLKVKVGEGMWSPPIDSTPDPYRDLSQRKDPLIEAAENAIALNEPI